MPSPKNPERSVVVDLRGHAEPPAAEQAPGKNEVQLRQHLHRFRQAVRVRSDLGGKGGENPGDFALFLHLPLFEFVAHLHRGHGLDKKRGAGRGLVMHQARHAGAVLRSHRQHIPVVPHGHDRILQRVLQGRAANHLIQLFPDPVLRAAQVAADVHQLGTGAVRDLILGKDGVSDILFQVSGCKQPFRHGAEAGRTLPLRDQRVPRRPADPQKLRHGKQHAGAEGAPFFADREGGTDVRKRGERVPARLLQDDRRFLGFRLRLQHRGQVRHGQQRAAALRAGRRQRPFRQNLPDPGKLQRAQRPVIRGGDEFRLSAVLRGRKMIHRDPFLIRYEKSLIPPGVSSARMSSGREAGFRPGATRRPPPPPPGFPA